MSGWERLLFDQEDHELLAIVSGILDKDRTPKHLNRLFDPYLHPRGIKELAVSRELRIAYAVMHLLDSLEVGKAPDRLSALRTLHEEVLFSNGSLFRLNTARILLQIMKELVRAAGDQNRQLELAHDFRSALSGKPRVVRRLLRQYHLLEMPEAWNQIAFDHHVHDANTKGRKSPTHLIMDAWIKGIRSLTIVYYNYIRPEVAAELLEAAEIMGVKVRLGVELPARYRDRYVQLMWVPRGFSDADDFLAFLAQDSVREFMAAGYQVSEYKKARVLEVLEDFNHRQVPKIRQRFALVLDELDQGEFLAFVGAGQASTVHLVEFIHVKLLAAMKIRVTELATDYANAPADQRLACEKMVEQMNRLDSEEILKDYLPPEGQVGVLDFQTASPSLEVPDMLKLSASELIQRLQTLRSGYRLTLNLSDLSVEDVLELLYDCRGEITHLEIFNLKDFSRGHARANAEINRLRQVINEGNIIVLKRMVRGMIQRLENEPASDKQDRLQKMTRILRDLRTLPSFYRRVPLHTRMGTDSTGRSRHLHGMGLVVVETLPACSQREIKRTLGRRRMLIPVRAEEYATISLVPRTSAEKMLNRLYAGLRRIPGLRWLGYRRSYDWDVADHAACMDATGNIATLGGFSEINENLLTLTSSRATPGTWRLSWRYLNTGYRNALKVFIGFVPAFATFALTKDWWLLAYLGAFIWFGITGLRNVLQSVLGGGGIRRSSLLSWNAFVSWQRVADSLMYTGISVPLLDYLVKTLLMEQVFHITTTTGPVKLYTVMAVANGLYITTHNLFRGLPKGAAAVNFFRALFSVPLAILFNILVGAALSAAGVPMVAANGILQRWAAIISKTASDCVAGFIEGTMDRLDNLRVRKEDYRRKFRQLFEVYTRLELLFPEQDVLELLQSPKKFIESIRQDTRNLERQVIVNALDLLYFWMYQPRAQSALQSLLQTMTPDEVQILVRSQAILEREREISQMFLDGMVGRKFSQALAFYLNRSQDYLVAMREMQRRYSAQKEELL
jgi:hypothetical protein